MVVRHYIENNDLGKVLLLYRSNVTGFTRDVALIKHFINHPGVEADGVFVAENDDEILGFAIVAIEDDDELRQARIMELQAKNASVIEVLLDRIYRYCCSKAADLILVRPAMGKKMKKTVKKWAKFESSIMMVKPLSLIDILRALITSNHRIRERLLTGRKFLFVFQDEIVKIDGSQGSVSIENSVDAPTDPNMIIVQMSSTTFMQVVFGIRNPYAAYLFGDIRIGNPKDALMVLALLSRIRVAPPQAALVDGV